MLQPIRKAETQEYVEVTAENIATDKSGALVRSVLNELSQGAATVKRKMNSGLSQDDFKKHEAFKESIEQASQLLEKTWSRLQR